MKYFKKTLLVLALSLTSSLTISGEASAARTLGGYGVPKGVGTNCGKITPVGMSIKNASKAYNNGKTIGVQLNVVTTVKNTSSRDVFLGDYNTELQHYANATKLRKKDLGTKKVRIKLSPGRSFSYTSPRLIVERANDRDLTMPLRLNAYILNGQCATDGGIGPVTQGNFTWDLLPVYSGNKPVRLSGSVTGIESTRPTIGTGAPRPRG